MKKIFFAVCFLFITSVHAQMSGSYTVGGASPNFPTIISAVDTINAQGVQGPITLLIRPGVYNVFLNYAFLNYSYPITFISETGDANDVRITMSNLYECRNLFFRKLTIIPHVNTSYMFNYKGLEIVGSSFITFDSCIVRGTTNPDERIGLTVSEDNGDIYFTNLTLRDLDYGIVYSDNTYYNGSNRHYGTHLIQNCDFDSVKHGIRVSGDFVTASDTLLVTNCKMRNGQSGLTLYGMYEDVRGVKFVKNDINVSGTGLNILSNALSGNLRMPVFINNMVVGAEGINMQNSAYIGFYNNSIVGRLTFWFGSTHVWMTNNNIVNDTIHSYMFSLGDKNTYYADHNNFYAPLASPVMFQVANGNPFCVGLADFQLSTGQDQHSLNVPPYFVSSADLHSYSPDLKFHGISIPEVQDDIDGELRNAVPDIGADEYHASALPPHAFFNYDCGPGNYSIALLDTSVRATTFFWDFGDLTTSTLEFPSHTWATTGPYVVTLIVTNSFGSDTLSDSIQFVQNIPTISLSGNLLTAIGGPYSAYQWNFNGSPINSANSSAYTAPFPGPYSVSVWETGSTCPYTTADIGVGIGEQYEGEFSLFPNPVCDGFIYINDLAEEKFMVQIFDAGGKVVFEEQVGAGNSTFKISLPSLSGGCYSIGFFTEKGVVYRKLVVIE